MLVSFSLSLFRRAFALPPSRASARDRDNAATASARLAGIVHEHLDAIYRTARRLGVSNADMDDAVQDVLVVVLRRLEDIERGKERAFVVAVAAGVAANRRRRERRHPEDTNQAVEELSAPAEIGAFGTSHDLPDGEQSLERSQRLALLEAALDAMTEAQRVAFVLFELEELTAREIGEQLGVSTFSIVSRVRRARKVLAQTIGAQRLTLSERPERHPARGSK